MISATGSQDRYLFLITSLPHLGPLFNPRRIPPSRLTLEKHLKGLEPEDSRLLFEIEALLEMSPHPVGESSTLLSERAEALLPRVRGTPLFGIVMARLSFRTVVAALRRHARGDPPPLDKLGRGWGFGRPVVAIQRRWNEPGFGLQRSFPWVLEAQRLFQEGQKGQQDQQSGERRDMIALEKCLLEAGWRQLDRLSWGHVFDFSAVLIYLLRWSLVRSWKVYEEQLARERFLSLANGAMGDHTSEPMVANG